MKKYKALIVDRNQLKKDFICDLIAVLGGVSVEHLKFRETFETNFYQLTKHPTLNLSETQMALVHKIYGMSDKGNGIKDVVIMIDSFKRGTKRLKTNPYNKDEGDLYEWTNKDGNEKYSHKGNQPNAHFRWNYGQRYTLTEEDLRKLSLFIKPLLKYL